MQDNGAEWTAEQLRSDDRLVMRQCVLPSLYLLSGACILMLKGERKDRAALAADLANVQAVIAGLIGVTPDGQELPTPPDSGQ